jgi:CRISPR/Cas system-associated endonuclease Cas1
MLNYLYALLESEARLALAALGLDPGIGVLHNDTRTRDSLACDLMEPVRPQVDAYLLDWLSRAPLTSRVVFRTAGRKLSFDEFACEPIVGNLSYLG